jgi:hypothetical protein
MVSLVISSLAAANVVKFDQSVYATDNCDATSTCTDTQIGTGNSQTNNCTSFSDCTNEALGSTNIQTNGCDSAPVCFNTATANDMRQSIQCRNASSCANFGGSDGLIQSIECTDVIGSCSNGGFLRSNTNQELRCFSIGESGCTNISDETSFGPENTPNEQKLFCASVSSGCANLASGNQIDQNLLCARSTQCNNNSNLLPVSSNTQSTTCANVDFCNNIGENTNVLANGASCESHDPGTTTICQPNRIIIRPNQ